MEPAEITIKVNTSEAIEAMERLTAAVKAATAALDELADRKSNVRISMVGTISRVEIDGGLTSEGIDVDIRDLVRRTMATIERDG